VRRRPFETRLQFPAEAEWRPLEGVAYLTRQSDELPSFHEDEFMYMGAVWNARKRLLIHLYKHRDTRRYLNLDDGGHGYKFCAPSPEDAKDDLAGGTYRLHRSLSDAVANLDLWLFDRDPMFFRSFPPEEWPIAAR
jgi:hypothetical protein